MHYNIVDRVVVFSLPRIHFLYLFQPLSKSALHEIYFPDFSLTRISIGKSKSWLIVPKVDKTKPFSKQNLYVTTNGVFCYTLHIFAFTISHKVPTVDSYSIAFVLQCYFLRLLKEVRIFRNWKQCDFYHKWNL